MFATSAFGMNGTAHMVSSLMKATSIVGNCFSFWYNMWHPNSETLNVLLRSGDNTTELLWTRTGAQGKAWVKGRTVVKSDSPHQVTSEAQHLTSY